MYEEHGEVWWLSSLSFIHASTGDRFGDEDSTMIDLVTKIQRWSSWWWWFNDNQLGNDDSTMTVIQWWSTWWWWRLCPPWSESWFYYHCGLNRGFITTVVKSSAFIHEEMMLQSLERWWLSKDWWLLNSLCYENYFRKFNCWKSILTVKIEFICVFYLQ